MFDLDAEIHPGESAAGVWLGQRINDILSHVHPIEVIKLSGCRRYRFGSVDLWDRNGRIDQIGVYEGYRGKLAGVVGIGSHAHEIGTAFGQIIEDDDYNLTSGKPGWCFEVEDGIHLEDPVRLSQSAVIALFVFVIPPEPQRYAHAFRSIQGLTDTHIQLLRVHYHSPERTITAKRLARSVGYSSYSVANSQYGRLARLVGDQLDYHPEPERLGTLVLFDKRQGELHWVMRPEVAEALELLGWVEGVNLLLPEEIAATTALVEGAVCRVSVNAYERNAEARRLCIERHGANCCICGFNFGAVYGEVADGYIHVHHVHPLSEIGSEYVVNPVEDLRPVCPNCHAVLHRRIPAYSIEDVLSFLWKRRETSR